MSFDLAPAADGIDEPLAVRVRQSLRLYLNIDMPHPLQHMIGDPVGDHDKSPAVHIREALADRTKDSLEYMIRASTDLGDDALLACHDLAALEHKHDRHAQDRYIEYRD